MIGGAGKESYIYQPLIITHVDAVFYCDCCHSFTPLNPKGGVEVFEKGEVVVVVDAHFDREQGVTFFKGSIGCWVEVEAKELGATCEDRKGVCEIGVRETCGAKWN